MIHTYKITSTGLSGSINLGDLGMDPLSHPVIQFDLIGYGIDPEEIENSDDLYSAISNGVITAIFDDFNDGGISVTSANVDKTSVFDDPKMVNTSGDWDSTETTVQTYSGDWQNAVSTVESNSAAWNTGGTDVAEICAQVDDLAASSGYWDSAYSTVSANSGDWALTGSVSGAAPLVKIYQGIDDVGGLKVDNEYQPIGLTNDIIKDSYYSHSTSVSNFEVTILSGGWYELLATTTVISIDTSQGIHGNPILVTEIDAGSGYVAQDYRSGGYIRENNNGLSTNITYGFFHQFNGGDKIRLVIRDSQTGEPNEETVQNGSSLLIKYIDRTGNASGTVEQLNDIGDVDAPAPNDRDTIRYNSTTSKWESFGFHDKFIDGGRSDTTYFVNNIDGGGAAG